MGKKINKFTGSGLRPEERSLPYGKKGKFRNQMVWDITADQLEELMEIRGKQMLDAVLMRERGLREAGITRRLSKKEISQTARNAGGMVFVDGVEGVTNDVGNTIQKLLDGGDKWPTIKLKVSKKDKARAARTEIADAVVLEWAQYLDKHQAWPKGKSIDGYEKWLRSNYETHAAKDAADFAKKYKYQVDRGHAAIGPNAKSMLSPQLRWGADANRTTVQWYITQEGDTLESISKSQATAPKLIEEMQKSTEGWTKKDMAALKAGELEPGRRIKLYQITSNLDHVRALEDIEAADIASTHARAFEEYLFEGKNEYMSTKIVDGKEVDVMRSVNTMEGWTPEEMNAVHHKIDYAASAEAAQMKIRQEQAIRQYNLQVADTNKVVGTKAAMPGKLRNTEALLRTGAAMATGNYFGAAMGAGQIAITRALSTPSGQKAIAGQIAQLAGRRGAATAAKLIPGLDVAMSTMEAFGYLTEGKLDQAGIAALSGAIGWIPLVGDGIAAGLDLTNTGLDIARLDWDQLGDNAPEGTITEKKAEVYATPTKDARQNWYEKAVIPPNIPAEKARGLGKITETVTETLQDLSKI